MTEHYRTRIAAERQRQIDVEGYTAEHDAAHVTHILQAARCYVWAADRLDELGYDVAIGCPNDWPWGVDEWKPGTPERMREKAGALALAAIDAMAGGPDVATTLDDLTALAEESVVRDADGWVSEKLRTGTWMITGDNDPDLPTGIKLPAVVLYRGNAS